MAAVRLEPQSVESRTGCWRSEPGFSLLEMLISTLILVAASIAILQMLDIAQREVSYQVELHAVMDNARSAMDSITRILRQAGNDPTDSGVEGIIILGSASVRVRSDLTGSLGPGSPDKGDPDGDTNDSGEDVVIRYNSAAQSIELVPEGGSAQTIAGNISAAAIECRDEAGTVTGIGSEVRECTVELIGGGTVPDPRTGRLFRVPMRGTVRLASRG